MAPGVMAADPPPQGLGALLGCPRSQPVQWSCVLYLRAFAQTQPPQATFR